MGLPSRACNILKTLYCLNSNIRIIRSRKANHKNFNCRIRKYYKSAFSGYYYDSLNSKKNENNRIIQENKLSRSEWSKNIFDALKLIQWNNIFANNYSCEYADKTLRSLFTYMKVKQYLESIEILRQKKK